MNLEKKRIHDCWFCGNKKSKLIKKCINSWKKYCPEYEIIEWNESNFDINCNNYVRQAYNQKKWAFVTDFARLWIIYNFGGVYLDTDVELIMPISDSIYDYNGFFCMEGNRIATGLGFYAKKGDKLIGDLINLYSKLVFDDKKTCVLLSDPVFKKHFKNMGEIKEKMVINNYLIYPSEYFCPLNYITRELKVTDKTIAIHWYSASWFSKTKKFKSNIKLLLRKIIGEKNFEKIKIKYKKGD